ncbi:hypothetical protein D3C73_1072820 [compost metagenome]
MDVSFVDDLARSSHVIFLKACKRRGRPRRQRHPQLLVLGRHAGRQGLVDLGVQLLDDGRRRARRRPQPVPTVELITGQHFADGGHVGQIGQTRVRRHGQDLQHAAFVVRHGAQDGIDEAINAAAHQILQRGRCAAIGDDHVVQAALAFQQFSSQVPRGSDGAHGKGKLAGVFLGVGQQAGQVGNGQVFLHRDRQRRLARHGHRHEILVDVERHRLHGHGRRRKRRRIEQQGVAVCRRFGDDVGADNAVAARTVFHDEALAGLFAELLRQIAAQHVQRAARRKRDHEPDLP